MTAWWASLGVTEQWAIVGSGVFLVIEGLKLHSPDFFQSEVGQRVLSWLPLALGGVAGYVIWGGEPGIQRGLSAGAGSSLAWEVFRKLLRKRLGLAAGWVKAKVVKPKAVAEEAPPEPPSEPPPVVAPKRRRRRSAPAKKGGDK